MTPAPDHATLTRMDLDQNGNEPRPKKQRLSIRRAESLFKIGNPDGCPNKSAADLARKAGCSPASVLARQEQWADEFDEQLRATVPGALQLPDETLEAHRRDMDALRRAVTDARQEMREYGSALKQLQKFVARYADAWDDPDHQQALALLESFVRLSGEKNKCREIFLKLQDRWTKQAGIVDLRDIQVHQAKKMVDISTKPRLPAETGESPARSAVRLLRGESAETSDGRDRSAASPPRRAGD